MFAGLAVMLMAAVMPPDAAILRNSQLVPMLLAYNEMLVGYIPGDAKLAYERNRDDLMKYWVQNAMKVANSRAVSGCVVLTLRKVMFSDFQKLQDVEDTRATMRGEDFAGGFSQALVRVVLKLLEHAKDTRLIDPWRPIAEHVKDPAPNVRIRVVGHLQKPIPNLRIVNLNFARTQSLNRLEP